MDSAEDDEETPRLTREERRRSMREQAEQIANDPRERELARQILEEWEDATAPWPDE